MSLMKYLKPIKRVIKPYEVNVELDRIIESMHKNGPIDAVDLEKLSYIKKVYPTLFKEYESKILYFMGLFYKPLKANSLIEVFYRSYAQYIKSKTHKKYTPVQANAYKNIDTKTYFSFSAPTSTGKSYLFMDLIKNRTDDIVIIVPTRALIAEYKKKLTKLLENQKDVLILQFVENVNRKHTTRKIYVLTPERGAELFKPENELNVGLFLFDEAQISEETTRGLKFDTLVRRINKKYPNAKKIFAHPFINNPKVQLEKHNFNIDNISNSENYIQKSVGKIYLTYINEYFLSYRPTFKSEKEYPTRNFLKSLLKKPKSALLVYISKSKIKKKTHLKDFESYIKLCPDIKDENALNIINKLSNYIGAENKGDKYSSLIEMMKKGVVIHHGSVPLKARYLIEDFINMGFAKICFATSTLLQGINMPFDAVWIDNYKFNGKNEGDKVLELKNLIGRAGRTNSNSSTFDYGYVIVPRKNIKNLFQRLNTNVEISNTSLLDTNDLSKIDEDMHDLVEAIRNDTFDDELQITKEQKERLKKPEVEENIKFLLDNMFFNEDMMSATAYGNLDNNEKVKITEAFKNIFIQHLRRNELNEAEQSVLSVAIRILLWKIEGRSFQQIVKFRYRYITKAKERDLIEKQYNNGEIRHKEYDKLLKDMTLQYSQTAQTLPKSNLLKNDLFGKWIKNQYYKGKLSDFDYDLLVYDTNDYLDDVISFSLSNPLSAAFQLYYEKTNDKRALMMTNYIRYGTNNPKEIMLLRYGFEFEDIEWLSEYVTSIDEDEIIFSKEIKELEKEKYSIIKRYVFEDTLS